MQRKFIGAAALALASGLGLALLLGRLQQVSISVPRTPDEAVSLGVMALGAVLLGWYLATALVALACLAARAAGHAWRTGESRLSRLGAPLARRLLLTSGSAAVAAAAVLSPAAAAPPPADLGPVVVLADDLGWGADEDDDAPESDQSASEHPTVTQQPSTPEPAEPASSSSADATYTVSGGDSLWSIAARHLPDDATAADIAASWPRWYQQNDEAIGDDPDLIHPGQVLTVPDPYLQEEA